MQKVYSMNSFVYKRKKKKNTIVLQKFGKCEAGKVGWGDLQFLCNLRKWINCCK